MNAIDDLTIKDLTLADIEQTMDLLDLSRANAPFGYLSHRSEETFRRLLNDKSGAVAVGAWLDDELVAYSLAERVTDTFQTFVPILSKVDPAKETCFASRGTPVHPRFAGKNLTSHLSEQRWRRCEQLGGRHITGLIALGNTGSLHLFLKAGSIIVGLQSDETSLNYVLYSGVLCEGVQRQNAVSVIDCEDVVRLNAEFKRGRIAFALQKTPDARFELLFN
jgi:GNAT superfamily N-acetyltransferase